MTKAWVFLAAAVIALVTLVLAYVVHVPLSVVLSIGFGAVCLVWLIVLLTYPWNLYFQAHTLLHEIAASRERGIEVSAERDAEAARIAVRMRWVAIGAHLGSAALLAVISFFSGQTVGYYFVGFYLVSTLFRPAGAYFSHLRKRMNTMLSTVSYPREDVVTLVARVDALEHATDELARELREDVWPALHAADDQSTFRDHELEARVTALGRQFEDTVNRLTDNQEVIAGVKAFLRMIREDGAAS